MSCEWNPVTNEPSMAEPHKRKGDCGNEATVIVHADISWTELFEPWHLCESCSKNEAFKKYKNRGSLIK